MGGRRRRSRVEPAESVTVEHAGEPLSRYEVRVDVETGELVRIGRSRLFGTSRVSAQPLLFALDSLGDGGWLNWLKALRLDGYAPRTPHRPEGLQQALFAHHEA